jgi:hypothetical protein
MENIISSNTFLEEFLNLLSPDGFCTLLRFFFFYKKNKEKGLDISVPSSVFQKHILVSEDKNRIEFAWGELSYWNLVKRTYGQNAYELNIGKIENTEKWFKVTLTDMGLKIRKKRNLEEYLQKYIDKIVSSFSNQRLAKKVEEVINGHIKYLLFEKGKIELSDIKFLTDPFFEVPQLTLEKTCDIYITSYYSNKPAEYIHGILKKVQEKRESKEDNSTKTLALKTYRSELLEGNKNLAVKIALGQVDDNKSYLAYIKMKDFFNLNKLYEMGTKILADNGRSNEIYKNYEWISK